MAAFTSDIGSPSRADSSPTIPGWAASAPGATVTTCSMRLPARRTPLRSNISPRGAGTYTVSIPCPATDFTATVLASTPCKYQSRPKRAANRQTTTTRTAVARRRGEYCGAFVSEAG